MIRRSLRLRLLLGAGLATLVALVVAWLLMSLLFERHLDRRLVVELTGDASRLAAALETAADGTMTMTDPLTDPRLAIPASGFYWQVTNRGATWRSRSLWDESLPPPIATPVDEWRLRRDAGPFDQDIVLLERLVRPDPSGPGAVIQLAQDAAGIASAQAEFGRELAVFLAALWLFLIAAAWLQVQLGLQPLASIRAQVAGLRSSSSARVADVELDELRPLAEAINQLAEAREVELTRARARGSDLAHGLKTPLAALKALARRVREAGQPEVADGLDRAIAALTTTTEAELARSRIAATAPGMDADVRDIVEALIGVLEQTDRGEVVAFTNQVPAGFRLPMAREDLVELLGPLIENAVRFARRQVMIRGLPGHDALTLFVDDDGPGIPSDSGYNPLARGVRLDQQDGGHGLGMAIAHSLVEASGGVLTLTRSALGGLSVVVAWTKPARRA
ncbi:sensor histidine kinase [Brevundimonas sp.]|uniref:sensor histidine kinase n=1 Tax=Brevundimonas sp. TaxID=1871086 RepID=UPI0027378408|nr:sensor histidine kinase [Brevundimonas sp.]MDP3801752.1 sensor histidine kinase [Brevundimonas sp.]